MASARLGSPDPKDGPRLVAAGSPLVRVRKAHGFHNFPGRLAYSKSILGPWPLPPFLGGERASGVGQRCTPGRVAALRRLAVCAAAAALKQMVGCCLAKPRAANARRRRVATMEVAQFCQWENRTNVYPRTNGRFPRAAPFAQKACPCISKLLTLSTMIANGAAFLTRSLLNWMRSIGHHAAGTVINACDFRMTV